MEERIQTEKICRAFAGKEEVNMAEIGLLLQREGIQYKAMGYAKLGDFMRALTAFSLEDRVSAPGNPPYTVVHMPKTEAREQGARSFGRAPEPRQAAAPHPQADRQTRPFGSSGRQSAGPKSWGAGSAPRWAGKSRCRWTKSAYCCKGRG